VDRFSILGKFSIIYEIICGVLRAGPSCGFNIIFTFKSSSFSFHQVHHIKHCFNLRYPYLHLQHFYLSFSTSSSHQSLFQLSIPSIVVLHQVEQVKTSSKFLHFSLKTSYGLSCSSHLDSYLRLSKYMTPLQTPSTATRQSNTKLPKL